MSKHTAYFLIAASSLSCRIATHDVTNKVNDESSTHVKSSPTAMNMAALKHSEAAKEWLCITYNSSWYLEIKPDGSGTYGYGAGWPMEQFPPETFKFTDVKATLLAKRISDTSDQPTLSFTIAQQFSTYSREEIIKQDDFSSFLFAHAHQAVTSPEMDEAIRNHPVFAHD